MTNWWTAAIPHLDIRDRRVNESLFAANLAQATQGQGPKEYSDAAVFFGKTYLTAGLRELLLEVLRIISGQEAGNPVVELQTSFGGGKTHAELAVYHLLWSPEAAMGVPQIAELVREAGLGCPPACRVAVLAGADINPLGRTTADGLPIRSLWGEMAYQLGGAAGFALVAEHDAVLVSPGIDALRRVLEQAGPCVVLLDETLHYIDKVSPIRGAKEDLARQTVAFLRELTEAVATVGRCVLVVSLTASRGDMLSAQAEDWLVKMRQQVTREAKKRAPTQGSEIHEIVRRRLFQEVNEQAAAQVAKQYRSLYSGLGLPAQYSGAEYEALLGRSYPFHPELVTVLYEQWGATQGFQLTRGTLRFLALLLQDLWKRQSEHSPDLIQLGDVPLDEPGIRSLAKEAAGDPQWEAVLGSDVAAAGAHLLPRNAKAQSLDDERGDGRRPAQALATTILMYSIGGGESPSAALQGLRLSCARPGAGLAELEDILGKFGSRLFYFYADGGRYRFRKEPNVVSLHHSHTSDPHQAEEVAAHIRKYAPDKALGDSQGFAQVFFAPEDGAAVPDSDELKLVVLGFEHTTNGEELPATARQAILAIVERRGQEFRQFRNTLAFCLADAAAARTARQLAGEYLAWRKIQTDKDTWARVGGAQQQVVKENLDETEGATRKAIVGAFAWSVIPVAGAGGPVALKTIKLGAYGPGKLVAPMVWERLSSENGHGQAILTKLTPQALLERYGPRAWPEGEPWVTTRELWERFTRQVGLPMLARKDVLLDTLRLGQREGRFAIGQMLDEKASRDQRDSYAFLYFQDASMPGNAPELGQRWLAVRPGMYEQIAEQPSQVQPGEVLQGIKDLGGDSQPVKVAALSTFLIGKLKIPKLDERSFQKALEEVVGEQKAFFRIEPDGSDLPAVPPMPEGQLQGFVGIPKQGERELPPAGRTIIIEGTILLNQLAPLYNNILKAISAQSPSQFSIKLNISARFDTDPGGTFDANLEDGWKQGNAFPNLTLADSKKR